MGLTVCQDWNNGHCLLFDEECFNQCLLKPINNEFISKEQFREQMYHRCFEVDNDPNMQKWDSGCWLRWKLFEEELEKAPTIILPEKKCNE